MKLGRTKENPYRTEELHRALFEQASDGIFIVDARGCIVEVNPKACSMLGYSSKEILGLSLKELIPVEDTARDPIQFEDMRGVSMMAKDGRLRCKDGRLLSVEINARELSDGNLLCLVSDNAERKQVGKELLESEEVFHSTFENATIGIYRTTPDGRVLLANPAIIRMLGFSSFQEFAQHNMEQLASEAGYSRKRFSERIEEEGIVSGLESTWRCSDGSAVFVRESAKAIRDTEGRILYYEGTVEDITERKQAQEALLESEERFRSLFENATIGIYRTTPDGRILLANPAMVRMMGFSSFDELAKHNLEQVALECDYSRSQFRERMEREGRIAGLESTWKRPDGSVIFVRESAKAFRDAEGRTVYYDGTVEDITERRQAEEALRESEERYRQFFEEDVTGDFLSSTDGQLVACNPAYVKMIQAASREEAMSVNFLLLYPKKEKRDELLDLLKEKKKLIDYEMELQRRDGSPMYARANIVGIFDESGELVQIKGYLIDETERKLLEQQLVQTQKLEGIGNLAGGVAHDFNNILGIVIGYSELTLGKLHPDDPLRPSIQAVLKAASRGADLTKQLLTFARKDVVSPVALNLNDSISSIATMLIRLIGEDIKLAAIPQKDLWNIKIDPTHVDQILVNLSTNSRHAIDDVGTITIETANVTLDEEYCRTHLEVTPGDYVMLSFSDTGKGMNKTTLERIFEPFFTTKLVGEGTGLGLSTVFGIVKQNGGHISVSSQLDKGATFKIYFPRFFGEKKKDEEKKEEVLLTGTETVLVVEDDPGLLELARKGLQSYGYTVLAARSPGEAILLAEKHPHNIQLLLTDVVMPMMNGRELSERIEQLRPGIKCIYMSGYTVDVIVHRGILEDTTNFIQKPFTPSSLTKQVREVLDKTSSLKDV